MKVWIVALAVCLGLLGMSRTLRANPERHEVVRVAEDDTNWEQPAPEDPPEAPAPAPDEDPPPPPTED